MQNLNVTAPDGTPLAVQVCGNLQGGEIVFIHGFSQCHLAWARQMEDADLARDFRMTAYDLRGHGGSGKPVGREWYYENRILADDLAAVIAAAGLARPVLVAWSYAGRIVSDYVRVHGQERIGGIVFVGAVTKSGKQFIGPGMDLTAGMLSEDIGVNVAATRRFVRVCFAREQPQETIETLLDYNMMVPPKVRACLFDRPRNDGEALPSLRVPVLVMHGDKDLMVLPVAGEFTASAVPGAKLSIFEGVGHTPHMEDPVRFNRELAAFVRASSA